MREIVRSFENQTFDFLLREDEALSCISVSKPTYDMTEK